MERYRDLSRDPAAMLALAHPTRLALLELLGSDGAMTASEAAVRLRESPGTMSWHFRMLAKHGFVIEAPNARGRRRPWTLAALGTRWNPLPRSESERAAADLLSSIAVERAIATVRSWLAGRHRASAEWQAAAAISDWTLYVTAAEAQVLREQIYQLFERFADRLEDPSRRPADAIAVRALIAIVAQDVSAPDNSST